jgi:ABC-type histidine transport system ATPase subunit
MRNLAQIDPELLDQAVRKVCAQRKSGGGPREAAIAFKLSESPEVLEWLEMLYAEPPASRDPEIAQKAIIMASFAIGIEIGYMLGVPEGMRSAKETDSRPGE